MKPHAPSTREVVDEMRRAFDRSFSLAPAGDPPVFDDFIVVRIGADRVAFRRTEIAGLEAKKRVIRLPTVAGGGGLLGVAGVRGRLLPVYSLPAILGYRETRSDRYWIAVVGSPGDPPVGFAFTEFAGYLHVRREDIAPLARETTSVWAREVIDCGGTLCLVLSVPRLVGSGIIRTPPRETPWPPPGILTDTSESRPRSSSKG